MQEGEEWQEQEEEGDRMKRPATGSTSEQREQHEGEGSFATEIDGAVVLREAEPVVQVRDELSEEGGATLPRVRIAEREVEQVRRAPVPVDELAAAEEGRLLHGGKLARLRGLPWYEIRRLRVS